jgi:hypothetical protein
MINSFLWIAIVTIVIAVGLAFLVNKVIPLKMYGIVKILFLVVIAFLGYQLFNSVFEPVRFNTEKVKRYETVIPNLKKIRDAEVFHAKLKGKYTDNWNELIQFIETAKIPIIVQRDSAYTVQINGIDTPKEMKVLDTIAWVPVKDSLFKGKDDYKSMMYVPIKDKFLYYKGEGKNIDRTLLADNPATYNGGEYKPMTFDLKTSKFVYKKDTLSLFRVMIDKKDILFDQNQDLVSQERQALENDQIKGPAIVVGSLDEVNENGNWPPLYDK